MQPPSATTTARRGSPLVVAFECGFFLPTSSPPSIFCDECAVQPGGPLYGLQDGQPVDPTVAYREQPLLWVVSLIR